MNLQRAFYEQKFEIAFLRAKGDAFQDLFEKLMGLAYKADFMPCRPWGNRGDRKNDGFLKSERRLFQVYAPNEMKETQPISKIQEDFKGPRSTGASTSTSGSSPTTPWTVCRHMCKLCCSILRRPIPMGADLF